MAAEEGPGAPGGTDEDELLVGADPEGAAVAGAVGEPGEDTVVAGIAGDEGVGQGLGAVGGEAFGLFVVGERGRGRDGFTVVEEPFPRETEDRLSGFPAFRLSGFPAFRLSGFPAFRLSGFPAFRLQVFIVPHAARKAQERRGDLVDVAAETGADREIEFLLEGLFPFHDQVSGVVEEFLDPVPEGRGAGSGQHDLYAGIVFQSGQDVHHAGSGGDVVDDRQDAQWCLQGLPLRDE